MIKIIAIDELHAKAVHAQKGFKSAVCGRAVIIDMPGSDNRVPMLQHDCMGYTDDVNEWDKQFLNDKGVV